MTLALLLAVQPTVYTVEGGGWFRFRREGRPVYAKTATLQVAEGRIVGPGGLPLWPEVTVGSPEFSIDTDGTVRCQGVAAGAVVLAYFDHDPVAGPDGLAASPVRPSLLVRGPGSRIVGLGQAGPAGRAVPGPARPSPSPLTGLPWTLNSAVTVSGPEVTVGDVVSGATGPAAALVLAPAPPVGVTLALDGQRVEARIRAAGLAPAAWQGLGRGTVRIVRSSQTVDHAEIAAAAAEAAAAEHPAAWSATGPQSDYTAPSGRVELRVERVAVAGRAATVTVGVYVDGVRHNSRTVHLVQRPKAGLPARGASVVVRIVAGPVVVETRGTVTSVDATTGTVTVKAAETGAVLSGPMAADGAVEVRR
jgi:hypothetical protein